MARLAIDDEVNAMSTMTQRSWLSLVIEADPDFNSDENVRTREYRFSQRREFRQRPGTWYATAGGTST